jgi:hypothetical protein
MGRHSIQRRRSAAQTATTAATIAVAAAAVAIASAGTANAKTHHGPGAPGNPFGTSQFVAPQAGVVRSSTTSIVRHFTTTSTPNGSNGTQGAFGLAGGPSSQQTSNGSRTGGTAASLGGTPGRGTPGGGTPSGGTATENDRIGNNALGGAPANGGPPASSTGSSGSLVGQASSSGRKH